MLIAFIALVALADSFVSLLGRQLFSMGLNANQIGLNLPTCV